jgi:hypothetical protein
MQFLKLLREAFGDEFFLGLRAAVQQIAKTHVV